MQLVGAFIAVVLVLSTAWVRGLTASTVAQGGLGRRTKHVDTRIGTGGQGWGIGQTNPGPQVPFGCMRLGPDTSSGVEPLRIPFEAFGGYWYEHDFIECFSHTHMVGSGEGDFQNFGMMVTRGPVRPELFINAGYKSRFSHDNEVAVPAYYAVELLSSNTFAEFTVAGTHSGIHRYFCRSYAPDPTNNDCIIVLDVCHAAITSRSYVDMGAACKSATVSNFEIISQSTTETVVAVAATVFQSGDFTSSSPKGGIDIYFYGEIHITTESGSRSVPDVRLGMWQNNTIVQVNNDSTTSGSAGAFAAVDPSNETIVFTARTGLSFVSPHLAKANLEAEQKVAQGWKDFERCREETDNKWEDLIGRVDIVEGPQGNIPGSPSDRNLTVLYSSLYRAAMAPTTYSESDGSFIGEDFVIHNVATINFTSSSDSVVLQRYLSDLSLWDIYRTQAPLLVWLNPEFARDLSNSMYLMYRQGGHRLPKWVLANVETYCMVGLHSTEIMYDAISKGVIGIANHDIGEAVFHAITDLVQSHFGSTGYVAVDVNSLGASHTLDVALDAGTAKNLLNFLGETEKAATFEVASQAYRLLWNNESQFICPKFTNGTWLCSKWPEMPYPWEHHWTEGNAAMYRWYVPHDLRGLGSLFKSPAYMAQQLNQYFVWSFWWPFNTTLADWTFWAGNEPDILTPVIFNFIGPEYAHLTQYWFPILVSYYYTPWASGVPGNDDYGTMSAWCVWGMLGIYPVASTGEYALFVPFNNEVHLSLSPEGLAATPWQATVSNASNSSGRTTIVILRAHNRPAAGSAYLANVSVNGVTLSQPIVDHATLVATAPGAPTIIDFYLTDEPTVFGREKPSLGGPQPWKPSQSDDADQAEQLKRMEEMVAWIKTQSGKNQGGQAGPFGGPRGRKIRT